MKRLLSVLAASYLTVFPLPLLAQEAKQAATSFDFGEDFSISLNSLGALESESASPLGGTVGFGTNASDIFTVGNFRGLGFADLTFEDIQTFTGEDLANTPLVNVPALAQVTPAELAESVPGLEDQALNDVPLYKALAESQGVRENDGVTVGDVAGRLVGTFGDNASSIVGEIIADVPGLFELTELGELPNGLDNAIADINGLGDVGIYDITSIKDLLAPFDIGFSGGKNFGSPCKIGDCEEKETLGNSASGNWDNFHIPCSGPDCSHIEVRRRGGISAQNNIRWFTNKQTWVRGGTGWLCLREPVGRYPFGDRRIKVVVTDIDEQKGTVTFGAYIYVDGPFGSQSANCFGPFPIPIFGKRKEGELTLFGLDKKYAREELAKLAQQIRASGSSAASGGGGAGGPLPEPVDCEGSESQFINPAPGTGVRSHFGPRRHPISGRVRTHEGIDLSRGFGLPVLASNCGVVAHASRMGGYGQTVRINHPNGAATLYAHNQKILVRVGQQVKRGQQIAEEGSTGLSTGPHVHFEWHPRGWRGAADPCRVLTIC